MLNQRSMTGELMDEADLPAEEVHAALKELATINRFLGGRSASRDGLRLLVPAARSQPLEVLDVGAGGGDVLWGISGDNFALRVTTLDKNPESCRYQRASHHAAEILCGDALTYPLPAGVFDVIHVSLFLHHFSAPAIAGMLNRFLGIVRYGIVINDLRRSPAALAGIWILTRFFSRSRLVRNDAPLSVRRAFQRNDLREILDQVECRSIIVRRHWAFRWVVVLGK